MFQGIAASQNAMDKYLNALPMLTDVSEEVISMAHMNTGRGDTYSQKQSTKCVANVKKVKKVVGDRMIIAFQHDSEDLANIATGLTVK